MVQGSRQPRSTLSIEINASCRVKVRSMCVCVCVRTLMLGMFVQACYFWQMGGCCTEGGG